MRAHLAALLLLLSCSSTPPAPRAAAPVERTCPDPIGRIVLEDCDQVASKYDALRFASTTRSLGGRTAGVLDLALDEADLSVAYLKQERRNACTDRASCKLTDPEYRDSLRKLDEAYLAMLTLHEHLIASDAQRAAALLGELRSLRDGWPKPSAGLFPPVVDVKRLPHFHPTPADAGLVAFAELDYPGGDLASERGHSPATCARACEAKGPACRGFVLGTGSSQGICWMKATLHRPTTQPQRTSYVPQKSPLARYVVVLDVDIDGDDLPPQPAASAAECAEACEAETGCTSFLFSAHEAVCRLRSKPGRVSLKPGQTFYCNPGHGPCP